MREPVYEATKGNKVFRVFRDENPENPRKWDNFGTMVCFHRRYTLGDERDYLDPLHFLQSLTFDIKCSDKAWDMTLDECQEYLESSKQLVILPIYLYDHSGLTINTVGFHCPWDSGQIGWIYATVEKAKKELGYRSKNGKVHLYKRNTPALRRRMREILIAEVKEYDEYLRGEVYRFECIELDRCGECGHVDEIVVDSCSGFYGDAGFQDMRFYIPEDFIPLYEEAVPDYRRKVS